MSRILACNVAHDKNRDEFLNNNCSGLSLIFWLRNVWVVYWRSSATDGIPALPSLTLYFNAFFLHPNFLAFFIFFIHDVSYRIR
jgi:hypothetical protein